MCEQIELINSFDFINRNGQITKMHCGQLFLVRISATIHWPVNDLLISMRMFMLTTMRWVWESTNWLECIRAREIQFLLIFVQFNSTFRQCDNWWLWRCVLEWIFSFARSWLNAVSSPNIDRTQTNDETFGQVQVHLGIVQITRVSHTAGTYGLHGVYVVRVRVIEVYTTHKLALALTFAIAHQNFNNFICEFIYSRTSVSSYSITESSGPRSMRSVVYEDNSNSSNQKKNRNEAKNKRT